MSDFPIPENDAIVRDVRLVHAPYSYIEKYKNIEHQIDHV